MPARSLGIRCRTEEIRVLPASAFKKPPLVPVLAVALGALPVDARFRVGAPGTGRVEQFGNQPIAPMRRPAHAAQAPMRQ